MNTLRWLRVAGDSIFALGAAGLGWFVVGLKTGLTRVACRWAKSFKNPVFIGDFWRARRDSNAGPSA
jgi:hypothetical protein